MLAVIADNQFVYIQQITVAEEDIIDKALSVEHPNARYIDTSLGYFDGVYHKYNRKHKRLSRGFLNRLKGICQKYGLPLQVIDNRPPPKYMPDASLITPDMLAGITLEQYQINGIKAMCNEEVGVLTATTGAGKSELMAGFAKIINCPTVILCDMTTVVDQLKNRLELRDVADEVGMFYAGKRPNGQLIIVGSIQSLSAPSEPPYKTKKDTPETYARKMKAFETRRKNARSLREIVGKCDLVMCDECDTAGSSTQYGNLFRYWFKGRRRYGFTGTANDPDKPIQNINVEERLGSVIFSTTRKEVEAAGRIVPFTYTAVAFGDPSFAQDKSAFDIALKEHLIDNPKFHQIIKNIAIKAASKSPEHGVMILVESKPLGYALEALMPNSAFICGDHNMAKRKEVIKAFESREIKVLIGGKIAKRGLDLKGGCETLILATGGKLSSEINQKIGRAVRLNSRGIAQIYDFFFLCNYYLYLHSRKRLKTVVALGYPAKVVFKNGVIEASKFIKSRFRRPK